MLCEVSSIVGSISNFIFLMSDSILSPLQWRYATKQFDPTKKISEEDMQVLLESLRLAPSSTNTQPWTFIVVEDTGLRAALREAAFGQPQVSEASHFLVLARKTKLDEAHIDHIVEVTAQLRHQQIADLAGFKAMMTQALGEPGDRQATYASNQVHIALGFLLTTAARMQIDACPMGGFMPEKFDEILHLKEKNLASVVICALGYRSETDKYATAPKSRLPLDEVILKV